MSHLSQTLRQFAPDFANDRRAAVLATCRCPQWHSPRQSQIHSKPNSPSLQPAQQIAIAPYPHEMPLMAMTNVNNRHGFDNMIDVYRTSGGTARADDLALLLEERQKGDFVSLARRMVTQDIFNFKFHDHFWIPMFQFDVSDMSIKKEVRRVINELNTVLDNWTLALWFTEPNAWLNEKKPIHLIARQFPEVLAAARADRFVAAG